MESTIEGRLEKMEGKENESKPTFLYRATSMPVFTNATKEETMQ